MARRKRFVSSDEAVQAKGQHEKPCSDCPWSRKSINGWLGGPTTAAWLATAHGDGPVDCHTLKGAQCAGLSIYRRNTCKSPRNPAALVLPPDRGLVFASPVEFMKHHTLEGLT